MRGDGRIRVRTSTPLDKTVKGMIAAPTAQGPFEEERVFRRLGRTSAAFPWTPEDAPRVRFILAI
jgi:hypothetical protein